MVPWRVVPTGIVLRVRATPRSQANAIKGIVELAGSGSEDCSALSVSTTAAPDRGAANDAILVTLAKALGIQKSSLRVAAGATGRIKRVEIISSDTAALVCRLEQMCR